MFTLKKQQVKKKAVGQLTVTIQVSKGTVQVFKIYQFDKLAKLYYLITF